MILLSGLYGHCLGACFEKKQMFEYTVELRFQVSRSKVFLHFVNFSGPGKSPIYPSLVFIGLVFYLHLGKENLVLVQNLNPGLVFLHQESSFLFVQSCLLGYTAM
jgi:hypothetical protein